MDKHFVKSKEELILEIKSLQLENNRFKKVIKAFRASNAEAAMNEFAKDVSFQKLTSNIPDLVFQFTKRPDGSYCVPIASEGIFNIFGCKAEDVRDNFDAIARVIHPDDAERVINEIEYSAQHISHFTCEFRVQIPGREIQWIFSRSVPELLPDGSITWYGFNADITFMKAAQKATEKLQKIAWSQNHEIRAPLTSIMSIINAMNFKMTIDGKMELLGKLDGLAKQLDAAVHAIVDETQTSKY